MLAPWWHKPCLMASPLLTQALPTQLLLPQFLAAWWLGTGSPNCLRQMSLHLLNDLAVSAWCWSYSSLDIETPCTQFMKTLWHAGTARRWR